MTKNLQMYSTITASGELKLTLKESDMPTPGPDDIVVRMEAAPINPSDMWPLFGPADMSKAELQTNGNEATLSAPVPEAFLGAVQARLDQTLPVGNEGAGVVVAAGGSAEAQALLGKTVGVLGGAMYSEYRTLHTSQCLVMNEGVTPRESASCFVNPLTALGMVETMRREGFSALIHTAAASNLGQMLQKICIADGVDLVNIVRKPEQAQLLREIGATHVCDSSQPSFAEDLKNALVATGAYLAFDATGGGELANQILVAMEAAANETATEYSRYGSTQQKQVYIYGGLERRPTTLTRSYGMQWGVGGWLLTPFLQQIGRERAGELRQRVADEIRTTFASSYAQEISLNQALELEVLKTYALQATGQKYLINPSL